MKKFLDIRAARKALRDKKTPEAIRITATQRVKAFDAGTRTVDFIISDATVDRDNDTIAAGGWDLTNFLKNPVVLWCHDQYNPPIAKAPRTRIEGDALISTCEFMTSDLSPFADMIFRMYGEGFLSGTSVGFKPIEYEMIMQNDQFAGIQFSRQELLEYSCCPVPSNPNALMRAKSSGIDTTPMIEWCERQVEEGGALVLPKEMVERLRKAAKGESPIIHHMSKKQQEKLATINAASIALQNAFTEPSVDTLYAVHQMPLDVWQFTTDKSWEHRPAQIGDIVGGMIVSDGSVYLTPSQVVEIRQSGALFTKMDDAYADDIKLDDEADPDETGSDQQPAPVDTESDGEDNHTHSYGESDTITTEAGDPPHVHSITRDESGGVTFGDAEGHNHMPPDNQPEEEPDPEKTIATEAQRIIINADTFKVGDVMVISKNDKGQLVIEKQAPVQKQAKTLYVSRTLKNGGTLHDWMKRNGFASALKSEDMHVTLAFSKEPVEWEKLTPSDEPLTFKPTDIAVQTLGDKGAVVMRFENVGLAKRWQEFRDAGASWDFDAYHPHVTLTYRGKDVDLSKVAAYDGDLEFGPEEFKEVNENWDQEIVETDLVADDIDLNAIEPEKQIDISAEDIAEMIGKAVQTNVRRLTGKV